MKHLLIFTFLTALMSFSSLAQTAPGSKFIGGSFQIRTESTSDNSTTYFSISPHFGYFLKDQWAIGSCLGFSVYSDVDGETSTRFSISPFTRYYVPVVENHFFIFGEAGFHAGFGDDRTFFGLNASPGFAFFPSERWSVELGFSLLSFGVNNPEGENNNTTSFSFGISTFSPSIGVNFFF